jgi:predicted RNA-binding Zn-ribbon protein involved in translation (DUF1610 family)
MTIEFHCPYCQKLLRTADDKAGVQANCPGCGQRVVVPAADSNQLFGEPLAPAPEAAVFEAGSARHASGRGASQMTTTSCPMCGEENAAPAKRCRYCGEDLIELPGPRGNFAPHRGGLILALGILGWVVCFPLGIAAWVMGSSDLREMAAGRMDPQGEGLTRAGKILGAVQCCLLLVAIPLWFLALGFAMFAR